MEWAFQSISLHTSPERTGIDRPVNLLGYVSAYPSEQFAQRSWL